MKQDSKTKYQMPGRGPGRDANPNIINGELNVYSN